MHRTRTAAATTIASAALALAPLVAAAPADAATGTPFTYTRTGVVQQPVQRGSAAITRATYTVRVSGVDYGNSNKITRITVDPSACTNPCRGFRITGSSGHPQRNWNVRTDRTGVAVVAYEPDHTITDTQVIKVNVAVDDPYSIDPVGHTQITGRYL